MISLAPSQRRMVIAYGASVFTAAALYAAVSILIQRPDDSRGQLIAGVAGFFAMMTYRNARREVSKIKVE